MFLRAQRTVSSGRHVAQTALVRALRRHRSGGRDCRTHSRDQDLARGHRRGAPGQTMTKADLIVERGAALLEDLSRKMAAEGGFAAKLAEPLAEDAVFLRKLKPSLVAARLRGEAPTDGQVVPQVVPISNPAPPKEKKKSK